MKFVQMFLFFLVLSFAAAFAQTVAFRGSPDVPAALGEAKVYKDHNGNSVVKIKVDHLAPPQNLSPTKELYVVWAQTPQERIINLGQMIVGPNRVGKFEGVTPFREFRLLITAEDLAAVAMPTKQEILSTEVFEIN